MDMQLKMFFEKSCKWEKYSKIFVEMPKQRNRPSKAFLLRIASRQDAVLARKSGVPLLWIEPDNAAILHYPMAFPPVLIVPREFKNAVNTENIKVHVFQSMVPFHESKSIMPRPEDVIVFMLSFDLIAARAMIERSAWLTDFNYLMKRIFQENLEEQASMISIRDFKIMPFKKSEQALPKKALMSAVKKNFVRGIVP